MRTGHFCSAGKFGNLARIRFSQPFSRLQVKCPTPRITTFLCSETYRFFKENKTQKIDKYFIADNS